MPQLLIEGITVDFPYEPYECQREYMRQNIIALKNGQNALLESPTGTGKTLCLLCSTLAYQAHMYRQLKARGVVLEYASGSSRAGPPTEGGAAKVDAKADGVKGEVKPPTIIYASRTHSQITQVVRELRATSYKVKMTVLASRDQLCVDHKISKLRGSALNFACNRKNSSSTCMYKRNLDQYRIVASDGVSHPTFDIEDLVNTVGKQDKVCPYFYSREEAKDAEIVLLPYNYLFDPEVRNTLTINFNQSIIILDEGHNIEKVAADAASFAFTTTTMAQCISELQNCLRHIESGNPEDGDKRGDDPLRGRNRDPEAPPPKSEAVTAMLKALFDIERAVDLVPLSKYLGNTPSCVLAGRWMADLFERASITHEKSGYFIHEMRCAGKFLMSQMMDAVNGEGDRSINVSIPEPKLMAMANNLARVFRTADKATNIERAQDYKVFVCEEDPKEKKDAKPAYNNRYASPAARPSTVKKRIVNFWAFTSGIAMEELRSYGVRSFVITSGTLSPLEAFKDDMKIPFQVQLENPHVIDSNQLWVGALTTGASGRRLNSSYDNRETDEYKDEVGQSVVQICMTMYGRAGQQQCPQGAELRGGVLLFFPSYKAMESMVARWRQTGLMDSLRNYGGPIIIEPRAGASGKSAAKPTPFTGVVDKARKGGSRQGGSSSDPFETPSALNHDDDDEGGEGGDAVIKGIVSELEAALRSNSRCIVMAVCRGKVSEGIDFKDERGRVVIITGIPFAPTMDPWVRLKQDYLDEKCGRVTNSSISISANASASANFFPKGNASVAGKPPANAMASYGSVVGGNGAAPAEQSGHALVNTAIPVRAPYPPPPLQSALPPSTGFVSAKVIAAAAHLPATPAQMQPPKPPPPKGFLDGKSWYLQSASRAVNQAIGRVIRHKHDWGCIFLLDDRFPQSTQKSQLSSWVRPRMQTFTEYRPSLVSFRSFVSAAMARPDLNPAKCIFGGDTEATVVEVKPINVRIRPKADGVASALDSVTRQVTVEASALPCAGDGSTGYASYIDPDLLLTQNVEESARPLVGTYGRSSRDDAVAPQRAREGEENADLESIFSVGEAARSRSSQSSQSSSSVAAAPRMADIFNRQHKVVSATSSTTRVAPSSTPLMLAAAQPMRRDVLSRQPAPAMLRPAPAPTLAAVTASVKTSEFNTVVLGIKAVLSEERFMAFTLLVKRAQATRLSTVASVKDFAERLRGVFTDVDLALAGPLMLRLSLMVDVNEMLQAVYSKCVTTIMNNIRYEKGLQHERENELMERRMKEKEAESAERKREAEAEAAAAAKRAKVAGGIDVDLNKAPVQTVVVLAEDGVTPIMQANYSNFFARKPAAAAPSSQRAQPPQANQRPSLPLSQPSQPSQRALSNLKSVKGGSLQCGVCFSEAPSSSAMGAPVYLAARCGHICCKHCWGQLLQRKQPCPTCRTPVSQVQLTKVVLK